MDNGDVLLGGNFIVQGQGNAPQNTLQIIIDDTDVNHHNVNNANFTIITGANDINVNVIVSSVSGQHSYTANVVGGDVIVTEEVDLTGVTAFAGA